MTYTLLSERMSRAVKKCAECANNNDGKCKYPILLEYNKTTGNYRVTKLINFSDDGMTCQLYEMKDCRD